MRDERQGTLGLSALVMALALALASAQPTEAEVRLEQHGDRAAVEVVPAPRGVWSANEPPGPGTLNAAGDILGDSSPAWATLDSRAVVAWLRPAAGEVRVATGRGGAWTREVALPASGAIGTPRLAQAPGWTVVAWRTASPPRGTTVAFLAEEAKRGMQAVAIPGALVDLVTVGSTVHVVSRRAGGLLDAIFTLPIPVPPIDPIEYADAIFAPRIPVPPIKPIEYRDIRLPVEGLGAPDTDAWDRDAIGQGEESWIHVGTVATDDGVTVVLLSDGAGDATELRVITRSLSLPHIPSPIIERDASWLLPVVFGVDERAVMSVRERLVRVAALADVQIRPVETPGAVSHVLSWWSGPRELSFVEVGETGLVLPVEVMAVAHGPEHPEHFVSEALRVVAARHE